MSEAGRLITSRQLLRELGRLGERLGEGELRLEAAGRQVALVVELARVEEPAIQNGDNVRCPVPFAQKALSRPQGGICFHLYLPARLQLRREFLELAFCRLAQAAIGKLLQAIGECPDEQVTTKLLRPAPIMFAPFGAQCVAR